MEIFDLVFDLGGLISFVATLIITIIIVLKYEIHKDFFETIETLKKSNSFRILPIFLLLLVTFISLWLTVRAIGAYVRRYIFTVNYTYLQRDIFTMMAYLLTTNLCLTLLRALTIKGNTQNGYVAMKGLIDVAIQAVVIGFITFIPRYSGSFLADIGGSSGYLLIALSMMLSIGVLLIARQHIK